MDNTWNVVKTSKRRRIYLINEKYSVDRRAPQATRAAIAKKKN